MKQSRGWCPSCNANVLATAQTTNHLLHWTLVLMTCGLWLWIYPLVGMASMLGSCRCSRCGHAVEGER